MLKERFDTSDRFGHIWRLLRQIHNLFAPPIEFIVFVKRHAVHDTRSDNDRFAGREGETVDEPQDLKQLNLYLVFDVLVLGNKCDCAWDSIFNFVSTEFFRFSLLVVDRVVIKEEGCLVFVELDVSVENPQVVARFDALQPIKILAYFLNSVGDKPVDQLGPELAQDGVHLDLTAIHLLCLHLPSLVLLLKLRSGLHFV